MPSPSVSMEDVSIPVVSWDEVLVDVAAEDEFWLAPVEDCVLELLLPQAVTCLLYTSDAADE